MDGQTALICVAVVVASAIVIILISWCSMQERSFDDVMEEQRRLQLESTVLTKSKAEKEKEKKQERKLKRRLKKGKGDKSDGGDEKEEEAEPHKMVELELEPEIIEPEQIKPQMAQESSAAPPAKVGKKKKEKRSILLNKEEHSYVNQEPVQETFHPEHLPKDEVEMLHERSRTPTPTPIEEPEPKPSKKERKTKRVEVPEEIVRVEEVLQMQAEVPSKKNKKHKADIGAGDAPSQSSSLFVSVREANLNDTDIQALIDILLNKQGAPAREWTKKSQKGDPVSLLRKQLEDREKALQEEQQASTLTAGKLKEMKNELGTERSRYMSLEKASQEKIGTQQQEIKALHSRMQYTHEQHVKEINTLQIQIESLNNQMAEANDVSLVQRLSEENNRLKEQAAKTEAAGLSLEGMDNLQKHLKMLQEELGKNVAKLNMSENAKSNLEIKINRYEEQINKLLTDQKDSEAVLERKVTEMNDELRRSESRNSSLQRDLDNHKNMANKLKDADKVKYELENKIKSVEGRLCEVEKQNQTKDTQLKQLHQENAMLSEQLKTTKERTAGEGQEAPHAGNKPNGDVKVQTSEDISMLLKAEHDKLLQEKKEEISHIKADYNKTLCEKNTEVQKLQEDLHNRLSQIEKMSTDLESQRKKNDELSAAEQRASELASELAQKENSLKEVQSKLAEVEARLDETAIEDKLQSKLESLRQQLEEEKHVQTEALVAQMAADKESAICNLKKQYEEDHSKEIRVILMEKAQELEKIKETVVSEKITEIQIIQEQVAQSETEIAGLKELLGHKVEEIKSQEEKFVREKAELAQQLEEFRRIAQDTNGNIQQKEVESIVVSETLEQVHKEQEETIKKLREQFIVEQENLLKEHENTVSQLEKAISQLEIQKENLAAQLKSRDSPVCEEVLVMHQEKVTSAMPQPEAVVEQESKQIEMVQEALKTEHAQLVIKFNELETLYEQEMAEKESRIQQLNSKADKMEKTEVTQLNLLPEVPRDSLPETDDSIDTEKEMLRKQLEKALAELDELKKGPSFKEDVIMQDVEVLRENFAAQRYSLEKSLCKKDVELMHLRSQLSVEIDDIDIITATEHSPSKTAVTEATVEEGAEDLANLQASLEKLAQEKEQFKSEVGALKSENETLRKELEKAVDITLKQVAMGLQEQTPQSDVLKAEVESIVTGGEKGKKDSTDSVDGSKDVASDMAQKVVAEVISRAEAIVKGEASVSSVNEASSDLSKLELEYQNLKVDQNMLMEKMTQYEAELKMLKAENDEYQKLVAAKPSTSESTDSSLLSRVTDEFEQIKSEAVHHTVVTQTSFESRQVVIEGSTHFDIQSLQDQFAKERSKLEASLQEKEAELVKLRAALTEQQVKQTPGASESSDAAGLFTWREAALERMAHITSGDSATVSPASPEILREKEDLLLTLSAKEAELIALQKEHIKEKEQLSGGLEEKTAQLEKLESNYKGQLEHLSASLEAKEKELLKLQNKYAGFVPPASPDTSDSTKTSKTETTALEKQLLDKEAEFNEERQKLVNRVAEQQAELERLQKENSTNILHVQESATLREEKVQLEMMLKERESELASLRDQVSVKQQTSISETGEVNVEDLQKEMGQLKAHKDELEVKCLKQAEELVNLQQQLSTEARTGESNVETANVELTAAKESAAGVDIEVSRLKEELNSKVTELASLQEQLSSLTQQKQSLESEVTAVKEQLSSQSDSVKHEYENKVTELQSKVTELESVHTELQQLREEHHSLEVKNSELMSSMTSEHLAGEEANKLRDELNNKMTELANCQEQLTSLSQQNKGLEIEIIAAKESLNSQSDTLKQEYETKMKDLHTKVTEFESVQTELQQLREQHHILQQEKQAAEEQLKSVKPPTDELNKLRQELNTKLTLLQSITEELEVAKRENNALQGKLEAATKQHEEAGQQQEVLQREEMVQMSAAPPMLSAAPPSPGTDITIFTRVEERSSLDISRIVAQLDAKEAELAILQEVLSQKELEVNNLAKDHERLQSAKAEGEAMLEQVSLLQRQLEEKTTHIQVLNTKLEVQTRKTREVEDRLSEVHREYVQQQSTLGAIPYGEESLADQLTNKDLEIGTLRDIVKEYWTSNCELKEKLEKFENMVHTPAEEMTLLQGQLEVKDTELRILKHDLAEAQLHAEDLREKNAKASEALTKAETELSQSLASASVTSTESHSKDILKRLFPKVSVSDSLSHDVWVAEFEREASKYINSLSSNETDIADLLSQIEESKENNAKLLSQVQQYKVVVAETEGILNKLQSSVESEEQMWKQRIATAEEQATKAQIEVNRLQEQLQSHSNGTIELKEKVKQLEARLSSTQEEKESLRCKLSEGMTNGTGVSPDVAEVVERQDSGASTTVGSGDSSKQATLTETGCLSDQS